ncbi:Ig-like domain-containing protein [Sporosarcina cascadiensis]|uniref:Ig-like domain-containing protein n=1 Tax=Sporosarcina cascadiensis TaxID=2660747 RepID=UPI001E422E44|nr:Ig-like domain-containing protein [Sporosarcina cascadiensis]
MKKIVLSVVLISALVISFSPETSAKSFPSQMVENLNKSWKIKFSQPVHSESLDASQIYILDGTRKIPTTLQRLDGGYTVEVKPLQPYQPGKTYHLEVLPTIKSESGKFLSSKTSMPFEIADPSAAIQSIKHVAGEGLYNFKIKARSDVYNVKINDVDLHLTGWNEFSHTFLNLKAGSTVSIRAYSSTNQILETKSYTIAQ